jgi:hypothetical protein
VVVNQSYLQVCSDSVEPEVVTTARSGLLHNLD